MKQNKKTEEEKSVSIRKGVAYIVLFVIVAVAFFLCMEISILQKDIKGLQTQIEEMKFAMETSVEKKTEVVIQEPTPVPDEPPEQVEVLKEEPVKQEVTTEEITEAAHKVYLTFDDGPSANTEAILDILDEYNVKATFFILGKEDEVSKELVREIYERGHTIGMHSYSHVYSEIYKSLEDFQADFWKMRQYIFETIGADSMYYRFPGGSSNTAANMDMQECIDFLTQQGVEYYDWNIISGDGSSRALAKEKIVENCTVNIQNYGTSIILMHDASSKKETVEALPEIIERILAMEDTVILPITEETTAVHHVIEKR